LKSATVVVVGAGVAGTAAALAASQAGARVVLADGGTGASTLSTGAIDAVPWQTGATSPVGTVVRSMLETLGAYLLPDAGARVATTAGVVRPARGHDAAILDVAPFAGGRVGVVSCDRPGWDAVGLARAWGTGFVALDATAIRHVDERVLPAADYAARHDDETRLAWLSERLRDALARAGDGIAALLLPPSLGLERPRALALSRLVGIACGEAIGLPGGPSGLRFERARDRAVEAAGIEVVRARVRCVEPHEDRWHVVLEEGADALDAAAVVFAAGGLVGGGLEYAPAEAGLATVFPAASRPPFRLGLDAPVTLGAHGEPLEAPGSLFGIAPESLAWPFTSDALMDRVGVLTADGGRAGDGLYAAGEIVADAPRTWLNALESGARAGASAARSVVTETRARPSPVGAPASRP
jgi:glycerol-3-phosphate dehydrogenase subunit B